MNSDSVFSIYSEIQNENLIPVLSYNENSLTFYYSALFFEDSKKTQYSYYLDGYSKDWSEYSLKTETNFTNLREGKYTFKVKAMNVYGFESETTEYCFQVLPPWYRTWWAYTSYLFIIICLIWIIVRYNSIRLLKAKERLEKIIKDRTYEIQRQKEELQTTLENLRTTQNELIQSEKMASLGKLIAGIAHELNTPLGAINSSIATINHSMKEAVNKLHEMLKVISEDEYQLFLKMLNKSSLESNYLSSKELRKIKKDINQKLEELNIENADTIADILVDIKVFTDIEEFIPLFRHKKHELILQTAYSIIIQQINGVNIQKAIENASKIIYALKNYSHSNAAEDKVNTDINNNIEIVLTIYHNQLKHGVEVIKKFEKIPEIKAFPDQLNQIWTNLIHNAIQAMDNKGKIELGTKQIGNKIVISVKDYGKGIPDEIKDKIFNPFFTTKPQGEGTGLGLDIVRKIVENHNGKIYFESKINEGTTFYVELPVNNG